MTPISNIFICIVFIFESVSVLARDTKAQKELRSEQFWSLLVAKDMMQLSCSVPSACDPSAVSWLGEIKANFKLIESRFPNKLELASLLHSIESTLAREGSAPSIRGLLDTFSATLIKSLDEKPVPTETPDFQQGKKLFEENCSHCHGVDGSGAGTISSRLKSKPHSLNRSSEVEWLSPLSVYAAAAVGVKGSEMPSYREVLSASQIWDISFYVLALPYLDERRNPCRNDDLDLVDITLSSNQNLNARQRAENCPDRLQSIRRFATFDSSVPRELKRQDSVTPPSKIRERAWSVLSFVLVVALFLIVLLRVRR